MKNKKIYNKILKSLIYFLAVGLIALILYADHREKQADKITIKSQYTYNIHIDSQGNVLQDTDDHGDFSLKYNDVALKDAAKIWLNGYTSQFSQKYLSKQKMLKDIKMENIQVLDEDNKVVLVSFSAELRDETTEYFDSWNGIKDDGRIKADWVVSFSFSVHPDKSATIYAKNIVSPEEYGISQYNESSQNEITADKNKTESDISENKLLMYEIKNNILSVTYDGGIKYTTVPVDCSNLIYSEEQSGIKKTLYDGSYCINNYKTAFLQTEKNNSGIGLYYSDDNGKNWITSEVSDIKNSSFYYIKFFDYNNGIVVIGYDKDTKNEKTKLYVTSDGGASWGTIGNGPLDNTIKGVLYTDERRGFFCYDYQDGMQANLYMTKDGGETFMPVILENQELDSTGENAQINQSQSETKPNASALDSENTSSEQNNFSEKLTWTDVYKEALLPVYDEDNNLIIYLTQGNDGIYNGGKTVAKYISQDNGDTWKYSGQLEIK